MINPWTALPDNPPFVLPADKAALAALADAGEEHKLHLDLRPEPFLGRADAPVVLLNGNPGNGGDREAHARPAFAQACLRCLRQEPAEYPFFLLDPAAEGSGGYGWWSEKTKALIEVCGQRAVANALLAIELFPYHSRKYSYKFDAHRLRLPSQEYSAYLVRQAIARRALIVVMRAERPWRKWVPELDAYADSQPRRVAALKNRRKVFLTPGNLPDGAYAALVEAIRSM